MENERKDKWYFKSPSLIIGFLLIGPFILPLVWTNPGLTNQKKIIWSVIIAILSCLLFIMAAGSLKYLIDSYQQIGSIAY